MEQPDGLEIIPQGQGGVSRAQTYAVPGGTRLDDEDHLPVARMLGAHATFHKPIDLNFSP